MLTALREQVRVQQGRNPQPSAGIIDSQSVKGAGTVTETRVATTTLHIVRKPEGRQGFAVIPRRWAVERTFAWLTAHRRLARGRPATRQPRWRWTDCK
jgi:hypothetical protein